MKARLVKASRAGDPCTWVVGWVRAHRARGAQWVQEKPLGQLDADGQATSGADDVLAKFDNRRSMVSLSHFGH